MSSTKTGWIIVAIIAAIIIFCCCGAFVLPILDIAGQSAQYR